MNTVKSTQLLSRIGLAGMLVLLSSIVPVWAADPTIALTPMADAQLSLEPDGATIKSDEGYVTVSFSRLQYPDSQLGTVSATLETSQGAFTGNYLANGIRGLKFDLKQSGTPIVEVILHTGSGRTWYNSDLVAMEAAGEWAENNIAFDRVAGWWRDDWQSTEENWESALADVSAIGIRVWRRSTHAQYASVNAFQLLLADNTLTPHATLVNRLRERFGVDSVEALTEAQLLEDSDGNGIPDWQEIMITQTDPFNANDGLMVSVTRTPEGRNEVSWNGVKNGRYRVQVASHPAGPWVDQAVVQAHANARVSRQDTDPDSGLRFYRVVQMAD